MTGSDHESKAAQKLVDALVSLLRPKLTQSKPLRDLAAAAGELLLSEAQRAQRDADTTHDAKTSDSSVQFPQKQPDNADGGVPSSPRIVEASPINIQGPRSVVPLNIGGAHTELEVRGDAQTVNRAREAANSESDAHEQALVEEIDLALIVTRCQLKADACRVFVQRRAAQLGSDQEQLAVEKVMALITKARELRECYLWMVNRDTGQPADEDLIRIGLWYDAMADAVQAMAMVDQTQKIYESQSVYKAHTKSAMQMLAHANAGLREALSQAGVSRIDFDQEELHQWLRWETKTREVFLHRYMKIDDVPDITDAQALCDECRAFVEQMKTSQHKSKEEAELLKKIAYHAEQLVTKSSLDESHDWNTIEVSVTALFDMGLKAESKKLAMVLDPLKNLPPEDASACPVTSELLARMRLQLATASVPHAKPISVRVYSEQVSKVAQMLKGTRMVLIGGEQRPDAIERLTEAFELDGVDWIALTEHGSTEQAKAPIERSETALVAVLLRLAGHQHVSDAKDYAKAASKPFVVLKAGYNPEQVALAVLEQASKQLCPQV